MKRNEKCHDASDILFQYHHSQFVVLLSYFYIYREREREREIERESDFLREI